MLLITLAVCGAITETCFDEVSSEAWGLRILMFTLTNYRSSKPISCEQFIIYCRHCQTEPCQWLVTPQARDSSSHLILSFLYRCLSLVSLSALPVALSASRTQSNSFSYTTLPRLTVLELLYYFRTPSFSRVLSGSDHHPARIRIVKPLFDGGRANPEAEK
jgi:hypothetical protein